MGCDPTGSSVYSRSARGQWLKLIKPHGVRAQLQLLYEMLDAALEGEGKARQLMVRLGQPFEEIRRLNTVPGVGRIGAHVFVGLIQEPARFTTQQQLYRYCRLGIRDRSSDNKPLGYQRLDPRGHGVLKAVSYRAWLAAMKCRRGAVYEFYCQSLERIGGTVHARLNTQRKILGTLLTLWKQGGSV
ncbi:MAG: transposase [Verrucomicrobiae bacterium]|nr:transposase [Verrucomicrobiae bacterium]